jgi:hypothetical protein
MEKVILEKPLVDGDITRNAFTPSHRVSYADQITTHMVDGWAKTISKDGLSDEDLEIDRVWNEMCDRNNKGEIQEGEVSARSEIKRQELVSAQRSEIIEE